MKEYVLALDISMSCTGYSVFDLDQNLIDYGHIVTKSKLSHGQRLKLIYSQLNKIAKKYKPKVLILERGFSLRNKSTQAIYKVHGIVEMLFSESIPIYYAPTTVKKVVAGNGRGEKLDVQNAILEIYPQCKFGNFDESDSVAIGVTYFREELGEL